MRVDVRAGGSQTRWSLVLLLCLLPAIPSWAQIPGDETPSVNRGRERYLADALKEARELLAEFQKGTATHDAKELMRLFTRDAIFAPAEGWVARGTDEIQDSLASRLPRIKGFRTTLLDFTAGGGLGYYLGRLTYTVAPSEIEETDVTGLFVMVLQMDGRRWKIRSYLERPEPVPIG